MTDATRASWASALFELRGKLVEVFSTEHVFLAELNGVGDPDRVGRFTRDMDLNRDVFSGSRVRHTIIPYGLQSGGFLSETGTWNVPSELDLEETHITLARVLVPFSITVDVERDSVNNSNLSAVAGHMRQARIHLAKLENLGVLGAGDAKICDITDSATSLTTTCSTDANFDVLLPGTIWDILTRSNGADPGQGKRRKIASVNESTRVITWDTNQTASDGGSGNIGHSSNEGIYIPGSYGNAMQGLSQAAAITGTFQDVAKATNPWWQGTDGRKGVTTVLPLDDEILDGGVRAGRRWGIGKWDFGVGDPAVIDLYKASKFDMVQYEPQPAMLKSGFKGIAYQGADDPVPLIKEPMHKKQSLRFVRKEDFQLYGDSVGPDFLDDDGGIFRRFSRSLPKEADLLDRVQLGVVNCNGIVFFDNLDVAA